jgi:hypothetical protein
MATILPDGSIRKFLGIDLTPYLIFGQNLNPDQAYFLFQIIGVPTFNFGDLPTQINHLTKRNSL